MQSNDRVFVLIVVRRGALPALEWIAEKNKDRVCGWVVFLANQIDPSYRGISNWMKVGR